MIPFAEYALFMSDAFENEWKSQSVLRIVNNAGCNLELRNDRVSDYEILVDDIKSGLYITLRALKTQYILKG